MKTLSSKLVMLSLLTAVTVGSVYADRKKEHKKDSIVGPWNVNLFLGMNGGGNEEEATPNQNGLSLAGVIKFDPCGTLVGDGLVPFIHVDTANLNGFSSTITVGTWKKIAKKTYVIETSTVVPNLVAATEEAELTRELRVKTRAIVRLSKKHRIANIRSIETRAFAAQDICCKRPLKILFPQFRGILCKLCKPKKETKKKGGPRKGGPKKGPGKGCPTNGGPKGDGPSTDNQE